MPKFGQRVGSWVSGVLLGVIGNAIYGAIVGGTMLSLVAAIISHFVNRFSSWTPIALGALGACIFIGVLAAIIGAFKSVLAPVPALPDATFEEIVNQTFRNQEVPLDGYRYVACTFENVTFVYNNGVTGGIDSSCRWTGSPGFKSRDERIQQLLLFLQSLKIIPPQTTHGLYTQILADLPNPARDAVTVSTPNELASYWSRLVSARETSNEKFADMENTYEYVLNFWNELENNKGSDRQKWIEKNFPGQSLTPEQIDEFREKFLAGAKAVRASLLTLLNLLALQFPKLGV